MKNLLYAARPIIFDTLGVIAFALLLTLHVDLMIAVGVGVATAVGVVAWELAHRRSVTALQWTSLALVLVSAAATYLTNDPRYVMAKPSVGYAVVGVLLLRRGWMNRYVPPQYLPLAEGWMTVFGYLWAGLMLLTAVINLAVAVVFPAHWPAFIATFPLVSKVALFAVQYVTVRTIIRNGMRAQRAAEAS